MFVARTYLFRSAALVFPRFNSRRPPTPRVWASRYYPLLNSAARCLENNQKAADLNNKSRYPANDFPGRSLRPHQPSSESAEAQSLPKQLANIFRESNLRAFAALASCRRRGALVGDSAVTRGAQKSVKFAGTFLQAEADDLPPRVRIKCKE